MSAADLAAARSRIEHLEAERTTTRALLVEQIHLATANRRNWLEAEQKNLRTIKLLVQAIEALDKSLTFANQARSSRPAGDPVPDILADARSHLDVLRESCHQLAAQVLQAGTRP